MDTKERYFTFPGSVGKISLVKGQDISSRKKGRKKSNFTFCKRTNERNLMILRTRLKERAEWDREEINPERTELDGD